jgi:hypothetical protein
MELIKNNLPEICLILFALLAMTEGLPFMSKLKANGILHGLYLKILQWAAPKAKAKIEEIEKKDEPKV